MIPSIGMPVSKLKSGLANRWVGVGSGGVDNIVYSNDGISWTGCGKPVFTGTGYAVANNGKIWVAGGTGGTNTLAYSLDGISWFACANPTLSTVYDICWNGTFFTAVGSGTNDYFQKSTDGISWTALGKDMFTATVKAIGWNGTAFIAASGANIAYATSNLYFSLCDNTLLSTISRIFWNGSYWTAIGTGSVNLIATSPDTYGNTWTGRGKGTMNTQATGGAWNGTFSLLTGNSLSTALIIKTTGVSTYTQWASILSNATGNGYCMGYNGSLWIWGGYDSYGITNIASSPDGTTFTSRGNILSSMNSVSSYPAPGLFPAII